MITKSAGPRFLCWALGIACFHVPTRLGMFAACCWRRITEVHAPLQSQALGSQPPGRIESQHPLCRFALLGHVRTACVFMANHWFHWVKFLRGLL